MTLSSGNGGILIIGYTKFSPTSMNYIAHGPQEGTPPFTHQQTRSIARLAVPSPMSACHGITTRSTCPTRSTLAGHSISNRSRGRSSERKGPGLATRWRQATCATTARRTFTVFARSSKSSGRDARLGNHSWCTNTSTRNWSGLLRFSSDLSRTV